MSIDKEKELIRAAGGIVHSDGNIFFTNYEKFLDAARAAVGRASLEAVPDGFEREKWLQKLEDLIDEFGSESRTEVYHGGFHCRRSPEKVREEILSMLSAAQKEQK